MGPLPLAPRPSGGHLYRSEDEIEAEAERRDEIERNRCQQARGEVNKAARAAARARVARLTSHTSNVQKHASRTIEVSTQLRVKVWKRWDVHLPREP